MKQGPRHKEKEKKEKERGEDKKELNTDKREPVTNAPEDRPGKTSTSPDRPENPNPL